MKIRSFILHGPESAETPFEFLNLLQDKKFIDSLYSRMFLHTVKLRIILGKVLHLKS